MRLAATLLLLACAQSQRASSPDAPHLSGVISGENGQPVAHASVELTPLDPPSELRVAATDENGRFALAELTPGAYQIRVARAGLRQVLWERPISGSTSNSLHLTLLNSDRGLLTCSPKPPLGLQLVLRDAQTGRFIAENVVAIAVAENYVDTLTRSSLPIGIRVPIVAGIPSRAGTYRVTVRHPSYESIGVPVLLVPSSCGLTPVVVEAFLAPLR